MVLGKLDIHMQKDGTKPIFYTIHKINLTWIIDLNIKPETIKLLKEHRKITLKLVLAIMFWIWPKVQATKAKTNKWDHIKLKSFFTAFKWSRKWDANLWNGRKHL